MDLVALIARDVTARLPVCTYDRGAGAYAICTAVATRSGTTSARPRPVFCSFFSEERNAPRRRVQARVSRSLKDFARLRRELRRRVAALRVRLDQGIYRVRRRHGRALGPDGGRAARRRARVHGRAGVGLHNYGVVERERFFYCF